MCHLVHNVKQIEFSFNFDIVNKIEISHMEVAEYDKMTNCTHASSSVVTF